MGIEENDLAVYCETYEDVQNALESMRAGIPPFNIVISESVEIPQGINILYPKHVTVLMEDEIEIIAIKESDDNIF